MVNGDSAVGRAVSFLLDRGASIHQRILKVPSELCWIVTYHTALFDRVKDSPLPLLSWPSLVTSIPCLRPEDREYFIHNFNISLGRPFFQNPPSKNALAFIRCSRIQTSKKKHVIDERKVDVQWWELARSRLGEMIPRTRKNWIPYLINFDVKIWIY